MSGDADRIADIRRSHRDGRRDHNLSCGVCPAAPDAPCAGLLQGLPLGSSAAQAPLRAQARRR